jgi:hypothetical protein
LEVSEAQAPLVQAPLVQEKEQEQQLSQAQVDQALKCHFRLCGSCETCKPQVQQQQAKQQKPGDDVRTALYIAISMGLAYGRDAMIQTGTVHKDITPEKITGMILHSFDLDECKRLVNCPVDLGQRMLSCCEAIMKNAVPAGAQQQTA